MIDQNSIANAITLPELLKKMTELGGSDLHLTTNSPPQVRVHGHGEYVVGWIKRGPQGIIGTNKPDSYETVDSLLEDMRAGRLDKPDVPPRAVLEGLLRERRSDFVSYEDWQVIDMLEQERGQEAGDRPRLKFSRVEEMLGALAERKAEQEPGEDR